MCCVSCAVLTVHLPGNWLVGHDTTAYNCHM